MRSFLQSSFSVVLLTFIFGLTVFNTCQINSLEQQLLDGRFVSNEAPSGEPQPKSSQAALSAALKNPDNLLRAPLRPLNDDPAIAQGGHLRLQAGQEPMGFNPYIANGADAAEFARYVNNMLCQRDVDDPGRLTPDLALEITTPDEGLTYDIRLREGVQWHAPAVDWNDARYNWLRGEHELTSDDFIFVFDMMANPQVTGRISAQRNYFDMEKVEATGRYSFRVRFKERLFTNLPNLCTMHPSPRWLMMYDENGKRFDAANWGVRVSEHWYNNKGIGTGPYRFVEWQPGSAIRFEANPSYYGEPPAFERITVKLVKDQNAWTRMLKTGELDMTRIQPEQYRTEILEAKGPILGQSRIAKGRRDELGYFYVAWNADTPYFDTKEARQAMTLALDRDGIVKNVFYGLGDVIHGPFPMQNPCYDRSIVGWPYDLELARQKL
ncbi:MAG: ABC transporter substrate-binding protein, partial [Myxococcota bacterium]